MPILLSYVRTMFSHLSIEDVLTTGQSLDQGLFCFDSLRQSFNLYLSIAAPTGVQKKKLHKQDQAKIKVPKCKPKAQEKCRNLTKRRKDKEEDLIYWWSLEDVCINQIFLLLFWSFCCVFMPIKLSAIYLYFHGRFMNQCIVYFYFPSIRLH